MRWSACNIQQSLDNPEFGIRPERRIARPGRGAPITQKVWSEDTIVLAEMVHDGRPGAARSGAAVQQYDRLSGSRLAVEAVSLFCFQVVVCHCLAPMSFTHDLRDRSLV
jgi:hypothetical protein